MPTLTSEEVPLDRRLLPNAEPNLVLKKPSPKEKNTPGPKFDEKYEGLFPS
jgi:hypothetical protein